MSYQLDQMNQMDTKGYQWNTRLYTQVEVKMETIVRTCDAN